MSKIEKVFELVWEMQDMFLLCGSFYVQHTHFVLKYVVLSKNGLYYCFEKKFSILKIHHHYLKKKWNNMLLKKHYNNFF